MTEPSTSTPDGAAFDSLPLAPAVLASLDEMGRVGRIEQMQGGESEWHPLAELTPVDAEPLHPPMVTLQIQGGPLGATCYSAPPKETSSVR